METAATLSMPTLGCAERRHATQIAKRAGHSLAVPKLLRVFRLSGFASSYANYLHSAGRREYPFRQLPLRQ
jgi:hypothetical protein